MTTIARAERAIRLARKHVDNNSKMESSARLCLSDALNCFENQRFEYAYASAMRSLAYSVGIFHADYKKAEKF